MLWPLVFQVMMLMKIAKFCSIREPRAAEVKAALVVKSVSGEEEIFYSPQMANIL